MKLSPLEIKNLQSVPGNVYVDIRCYLGKKNQQAFNACIVPNDDYGRCGKKGDAMVFQYTLPQAVGEAFSLSQMERGSNPFIPDVNHLLKALNNLPRNIMLIFGWDDSGECFARLDDNIFLIDEWGYHFGFGSGKTIHSKSALGYATLAAAIEAVL